MNSNNNNSVRAFGKMGLSDDMLFYMSKNRRKKNSTKKTRRRLVNLFKPQS